MTAGTARTAEELSADLRALGVRTGQDLLVHSSMRRVGPVDGGAATLLGALQAAAGPLATVVVPAQTTWNSLTSRMFREATAGLDQALPQEFMNAMPGFDPASTSSTGMGAFAELVRSAPGSARSAHPQSSFAAVGKRAAEAMAVHELDCHLGERSPLGWLYRQGAVILLLGVGYAACTAFHLAEYRLAALGPREAVALKKYHCFTMENGVRKEHVFTDLSLDEGDFEYLGAWMDGQPFVRRGRVGSAADCRLLPIRDAVDAAVAWPPFRRRREVD